MGQLILSGTLVAGPPQASSSGFPGGVTSYPISNLGTGFQRATGILQRNETFSAMTDLGEPGHTVKKATFLYFKSDAPVDLRLTRGDGSGGTVVETAASVQGLFIREFPSGKELTELELLGTSNFEYFVSGNT